MSITKGNWMPDAELDDAESPNWKAVRKDGLVQLIKDLTDARIRIVSLEHTLEMVKLLRRRNENGY